MSLGNRDIHDRLIGLVRDLIGSTGALPDPFPADRKLSDLGVSSMKMVNLMLSVEAEFEIAIPQQEITPENFHSVEAIGALIARLLDAPDSG